MSRSDIDIVIGARDRATKVLDNVAGGVGGFGKSVAGIAGGVFAAQAALDAFKASTQLAIDTLVAAGELFFETSEKINDLSKAALSMGATVGEVQSLQLALQNLAGVDADTVTDALKEMQLRIGEMASGVGSQEQLDIMAQLGLDPAKLAAQNPVDQFRAIQSAIQGIDNVAERASVADKLLGGDSVRLLAAFTSEAEEMEAALAAAGQSGQVLSEQQAAQAENMQIAIASIQSSVDGLVMQATAELAPVIEAIAAQLNQWLPPIVKVVEILGPMLVDGLVMSVGYATDFFQIFSKISSLDFTGAAEEIENIGKRGLRWVEQTQEARERASQRAEERARIRERNLASQVGKLESSGPDPEEERRAKLAGDTIEKLERQVEVAQKGEEAVRRQEQLAAARNDQERERISLLQQQLTEIEAAKAAEEQRKKAQEEAEAKAKKQREESQRAAQDRAQQLAEFRPGADAVEGRLLTRGASQSFGEKLVGKAEKQVDVLTQIRDLLSDGGGQGGASGFFENYTLEFVG